MLLDRLSVMLIRLLLFYGYGIHSHCHSSSGCRQRILSLQKPWTLLLKVLHQWFQVDDSDVGLDNIWRHCWCGTASSWLVFCPSICLCSQWLR